MFQIRRFVIPVLVLAVLGFLFAPATASACAKCYMDPACECWRCSFALFTTCTAFIGCEEGTCGGLALEEIGQRGEATKLACSGLPKLRQSEPERIQPVQVLAVKRLPERT